ncbi:hypothetical protein EGR_04091 [Echinococcus granulosus]|uniref:Uncharacterized protein n=1 Tax=Echinococcus granulosus TaxID=6210 RepID=W6UJ56_ECHGR|nr:hypothetical protein EGR_04091 [Echinococcus granulosus]EUB61058.1 hypothetical protein EGR_04091 [Echinococcus granulosus]
MHYLQKPLKLLFLKIIYISSKREEMKESLITQPKITLIPLTTCVLWHLTTTFIKAFLRLRGVMQCSFGEDTSVKRKRCKTLLKKIVVVCFQLRKCAVWHSSNGLRISRKTPKLVADLAEIMLFALRRTSNKVNKTSLLIWANKIKIKKAKFGTWNLASGNKSVTLHEDSKNSISERKLFILYPAVGVTEPTKLASCVPIFYTRNVSTTFFFQLLVDSSVQLLAWEHCEFSHDNYNDFDKISIIKLPQSSYTNQ